MDNEEISYMQSQQSSAYNHDSYNKYAREVCAVMQISPALHPPLRRQLSINRPSPQGKKERKGGSFSDTQS